MAPRAPAKSAGKRGATMEPSATLMAPPGTPAGSPMCLRSRSASVRPRTMTPQEFDQTYFTPTPAAVPEDLHIPQKVAELIVMKRDTVQNSLEGQSVSPYDDTSRAQETPKRAPSKQQTRSQRAPSKSATPSSGVTKSANKGRQATPGAGNRASPATTTTPHTTTPANPKLAAMLVDLREHGRETEAATNRLEIALGENISAKKEARDAMRQVKKLALAAKKDAIKMAERANRERDEALETTKEAWRIGERYR